MAGRTVLANVVSQIVMFLTASRMIIASPLVMALASAKGDVVKDKRAFDEAR